MLLSGFRLSLALSRRRRYYTMPGGMGAHRLILSGLLSMRLFPPSPLLLYLGRGLMELLSEMSYGMFGPGGECFLNTYRAKRELKILYFDGYTGMISGGGRDAQDALLYGEVKDDDRGHGNGTREGPIEGEYRRARDLCRWAKELQSGVDGFVRMNSGL